MLIGLTLPVLVGLRVLWGIVGSRYARLSSFALRPKELVGYFKDFLLGNPARNLGHNPASSWAAIIMMALALGLAVTGYLMTSGGNKETFEEVHELFSSAFIVVVIAHVSGIILHTLRHKDPIGLSMVNGRKQSIEGQAGISHSYWPVALLFVAIVGAFTFHLGKNFDTETQSLQLFGNTLRLGGTDKHADKHHDEAHDKD